ncbi:MAG: GNAT family N-acetyltransferase [Lachnospiraceae bacterium]|nr:GNAT family N-acetyltransferase [Lachnospiraceae bacterium]
MNVLKLESDKFDEVKLLFKDIFMNEPWNDDWSNDKQLTEYMLDLMGNRNSLAIGLFDENELIGFSLGSIMHWWIGAEYYIFEFCIKRERQQNGLGTLFLNEIEAYVKSLGINHIFLQTDKIAPAYEFYKKNGFSELEGHVSLVKMFD